MEGIDFEPTGEGSENINDPITEDELRESRPSERTKEMFSRWGISRKQGYKLFSNQDESNENWGERVREEIELKEINKKYDGKSRSITTAARRIRKSYPNWNAKSSSFIFDLDDFDRVIVFLKTKNSKVYLLSDYDKLPASIQRALGESAEEIRQYNEGFDIINRDFPKNKLVDGYDIKVDNNKVLIRRKGLVKYQNLFSKDGELNQKLPKIVKESLGDSARAIIEGNEEVINRKLDKITQLEEKMEEINEDDTPETISTKEKLNETINEQIQTAENEIKQLEQDNEVIDDQLPLRDRVKAIFKKYGFTITAVVASVGVIIGVIVSSLKSGLSSVAKGLGNGLKTLGRKLGEILPGMVGAIASFIFRTAGEVVGFLAKNAWLLIVAVVLYVVEKLKK